MTTSSSSRKNFFSRMLRHFCKQFLVALCIFLVAFTMSRVPAVRLNDYAEAFRAALCHESDCSFLEDWQQLLELRLHTQPQEETL